jgi:hypothetical protein
MGKDVELKRYNYDTKETESLGTVSLYTLVHSITPEQFGELLSDYLNSGMKDFSEGERLGKQLHNQHRTIQASIIRFALGIIMGLSKQEYTDARNETPVAMGKKIASMVENGELKMGYMI